MDAVKREKDGALLSLTIPEKEKPVGWPFASKFVVVFDDTKGTLGKDFSIGKAFSVLVSDETKLPLMASFVPVAKDCEGTVNLGCSITTSVAFSWEARVFGSRFGNGLVTSLAHLKAALC